MAADFRHTVSFENVICERQTAQAILVYLPDREEPVWIPQSQIDDTSEVWKEGQQGDLVVSEWIAVQKGLV